ncbi:hypothetical protein AB1N83_007366 [Pleurotus pulmonarius]
MLIPYVRYAKLHSFRGSVRTGYKGRDPRKWPLPYSPPPQTMHAGEDDKAALTEPTKADSIAHESEPPLPPYSRAHPADLNGRPAAEQSVNWLNVSRENESIRGTYVVDPQLEIPAALLALPSTEGGRGNKDKERMNLVLETKEGDIDVTVHIVGENGNADGLPGSSAEIEQKVKVKMRSFKGSVTCRIVPIDESNDLGQAVTRPRFIVYASADNGCANILLPRSFAGSISAFAGLSPSPRGPIELSPDLRRNARILMDTDRKRFFVGDFTQFDKHSSWDAVSIGVSSGSVKVGYSDENQRISLAYVVSCHFEAAWTNSDGSRVASSSLLLNPCQHQHHEPRIPSFPSSNQRASTNSHARSQYPPIEGRDRILMALHTGTSVRGLFSGEV